MLCTFVFIGFNTEMLHSLHLAQTKTLFFKKIFKNISVFYEGRSTKKVSMQHLLHGTHSWKLYFMAVHKKQPKNENTQHASWCSIVGSVTASCCGITFYKFICEYKLRSELLYINMYFVTNGWRRYTAFLIDVFVAKLATGLNQIERCSAAPRTLAKLSLTWDQHLEIPFEH